MSGMALQMSGNRIVYSEGCEENPIMQEVFPGYDVIFTLENSSMTDAWWRHQMEAFSALLAICAGNSPVTRSFDVFFDLRLNKR